MREFRTSGSVGAPGGEPPGATRQSSFFFFRPASRLCKAPSVLSYLDLRFIYAYPILIGMEPDTRHLF